MNMVNLRLFFDTNMRSISRRSWSLRGKYFPLSFNMFEFCSIILKCRWLVLFTYVIFEAFESCVIDICSPLICLPFQVNDDVEVCNAIAWLVKSFSHAVV